MAVRGAGTVPMGSTPNPYPDSDIPFVTLGRRIQVKGRGGLEETLVLSGSSVGVGGPHHLPDKLVTHTFNPKIPSE